jgi:NAD dependent epimerase/dehydratase
LFKNGQWKGSSPRQDRGAHSLLPFYRHFLAVFFCFDYGSAEPWFIAIFALTCLIYKRDKVISMNWKGKQVLVTGAGGFIGSHLVERLVSLDAQVRALARYNSRNDWGLLELLPKEIKENIEVVMGDLTDPFSTYKAVQGCSIVFHLAALIAIPYSYVAPAHYVQVNCGGTLNILEAARQQGVECLVHTSTSETYGTAQYTPIDESHPLKGQSPYAASKIGADKLAESYYLSFGLPVATVRPFNTYGPRQSARAIIPTIITQALTSDTIHLGSLEPRRDLTYVCDTVEGFLKAASTPQARGEVINLGTGQSISIGELAQMILKIIGGNKKIVTEQDRLRPETSEVWNLLSDNRRAQKIMGWTPQVNLEIGLQRTIDYMKANLPRYKSGIYNL